VTKAYFERVLTSQVPLILRRSSGGP